MRYPSIHLLPGQDRRPRAGHPGSTQRAAHGRCGQSAAARRAGLPDLQRRQALAIALFNPHSLIAARVITRNKDATIDATFIERRSRGRCGCASGCSTSPTIAWCTPRPTACPASWSTASGRRGLPAECRRHGQPRAGDHRGARAAAGAARDRPAQRQPGARARGPWPGGPPRQGTLEVPVELVENGVTFLIDPLEGQKTGWYYDQRDNRGFVARLAGGQTVLDLYSYSASFGLQAAAAGAAHVLAVDRSQLGLDLARASAERNGLAARLEVVREDAFAALDRLAAEKRRFGIVVADPPSFVRSKKSRIKGCVAIASWRGRAALWSPKRASSRSPAARITSPKRRSPMRSAAACATPGVVAGCCAGRAPARSSEPPGAACPLTPTLPNSGVGGAGAPRCVLRLRRVEQACGSGPLTTASVWAEIGGGDWVAIKNLCESRRLPMAIIVGNHHRPGR